MILHTTGNNSVSPVNVDVAVMPPMDEFVEPIIRPRKISCYNCGANTHLGPDCKEGSMEEMTRRMSSSPLPCPLRWTCAYKLAF